MAVSALAACAPPPRPGFDLPAAERPLAEPSRGPTAAPQPLGPSESEHRPRVEFFAAGGSAPPAAATRPAAVTTGGDVVLNFANTEIREAVRLVLGDILKLNYVVDPQVQGAITGETSRPLPRDAVLPAFDVMLRANGATLVQEGEIYRIIPLAERPKEGGRAPGAGTPQLTDAQRGLGFGLRIFPLQFVTPAQIQKVLEPFVPAGGTLQADPARNLLIVSGTQAELNAFGDLVQTLDVDYLSGMSFALFTLRNASPQNVVDQLNKIFGNDSDAQAPQAAPPGGPPPAGGTATPTAAPAGTLRFIPLERLNGVLAMSRQRPLLDQVRGWVERLDRDNAEGEPRLHVYYVQNSRAVDLAAVLSDLFGGNVATELPQPITAPGTAATQIGPSRMGATTGTRQPTGFPSFGNPSTGGLGAGGASPLAGGGGGMTGIPRGTAGAGPTGQYPSARQPGALSAGGGAGLGLGQQLGLGGEGPPVRIVADERNNALIIYAAARDYRMIEEALRKLDIVPLQVMIEATIAEVTLNDELRYGLQYFLREGNFHFSLINPNPPTTGIAPTVPGFAIALGRASPYAILSALSSITHVNVVSSPQVMVLDHQSAYLQVGDEVPISTGQATNLNNPSTVLVNTIQYRDTGVILTVTPRVNANGLVSLDIQQEVSAVAPTTSSTINSPTFQERRIQSTVAIQSGDTIALGGLIQDSKTRGRSGIPILADIPVLGSLFSTTDNTGARTELLVLLTPHVIGSSQQAREITNELRRRLRAVVPFYSGPPPQPPR